MKSFLLFLLLTPLTAFAQNAKIDSLKRVIETTKVDAERGLTLCKLCIYLRDAGEIEAAMREGAAGLRLAERTGAEHVIASCLNDLGSVYLAKGDYDQALALFEKSIKYDIKTKNESHRANSLSNIGHIYSEKGQYAKALEYLRKSLEIQERIGAAIPISDVQTHIGNVHLKQGDYPKALEFYQKSLALQEKANDLEGVAISLSNIGAVYSEQGSHVKALQYYQKSLAVRESLGIPHGVALSLNNIGIAYANQGNRAKALEHYQKSLKIQEQIGDQLGVAISLNNIGSIHLQEKNYPQALEDLRKSLSISQQIGDMEGVSDALGNLALVYLGVNDASSARDHAEKGLMKAREIGHRKLVRLAAQALYRADSALGNWKSAFEAARLFQVYTDSLKNDEQSKELGRLEAQFAADKERETLKARQNAEIERYNWVIGSSVGGLLLMMMLAFTFLRGRQKEKRANTELRALNDRISMQKNEIEAQNSEINAINAELKATLDEVSEQRLQLAENNEELAEKNLRLKLAQEQILLEQSSREQAQRMAGIGEISSIVAHEVNTPLGAIKGGAQNLIDRLAQNASTPELQPLIDRAALAQPLSSREERAALRKLEPLCVNAGFAKPEEAARQLVNCGLHDLEDETTLALLAREPGLLTQLAQTGAFMAQAANIQRAAERAATIVSALKTYSTLAGGPSTDRLSASVADTLGLVLKLYDYYLSQGIELIIDPMDNLPDVSLDAGALSQVWTKLLLNSIYGMNRKGRLEIRFQTDGGFLRVLWIDNGPSPSDEVMARAFEPGVALRETDPPIDLSLCRAFLEGQAGGGIGAHCPEDGGLMFSITIPLA